MELGSERVPLTPLQGALKLGWTSFPKVRLPSPKPPILKGRFCRNSASGLDEVLW
jgi:hypothetical protein